MMHSLLKIIVTGYKGDENELLNFINIWLDYEEFVIRKNIEPTAEIKYFSSISTQTFTAVTYSSDIANNIITDISKHKWSFIFSKSYIIGPESKIEISNLKPKIVSRIDDVILEKLISKSIGKSTNYYDNTGCMVISLNDHIQSTLDDYLYENKFENLLGEYIVLVDFEYKKQRRDAHP